MDLSQIYEIESLLGIEFFEKSLLQQAFIHRSFLNELLDVDDDLVDNERLEFLGDAVLG